MAVEIAQRVYWILSCVVLFAGLTLILVSFFFLSRSKLRKDFMFICYIPLYMADLSMIFDFMPIDINQIVHGRGLETSDGWCQFGGTWTVAAVFALNIIMVANSYLTRELVADRLNKTRMVKLAGIFTVIAWVSGIIIASIFQATGQIGNHRGLYCCIKNPGTTSVFFPYFAVVLASGFGMAHFYRQSIDIVTEIYRNSNVWKERRKTAGSKKSSKQKQEKTPAHIRELRKITVFTVGSFYWCWLPISLLALLQAFGNSDVPIALDIVAALLVKSQPLINSVLMLRAVRSSLRMSEIAKWRELDMLLSTKASGNQKHSEAEKKVLETTSTKQTPEVQPMEITREEENHSSL
eukprot:TRINITY_DN2559_c0_g3_i1.p1 TRINITY_DN2559_c0_g3~~TRINITY_DN2559_c0_g3_i1.p1  ORF type:complete len:351 (+),score=77.79 TRINITY_DN2559_c0_g3_i1:99-1151(+)